MERGGGEIVSYLDRGPFLNDYPNSEDLHAQECTHTWMILHIMCVQIKKKKKKKKKIDLPTLPVFGPKGQTNIFFFLGLSKVS